MRLFLAFELDDQQTEALLEGREKIAKDFDLQGRMIPAEQMHMTIAFCGEVSLAQQEKIEKILHSIPFDPFDLHIQGLDLFGNTLVVRFEKTQTLDAYVETIRAALSKEGIVMPRSAYLPHITLIRKLSIDGMQVTRRQKAYFLKSVSSMQEPFLQEACRVSWRFENACLYRSFLEPGSVRYIILDRQKAGERQADGA